MQPGGTCVVLFHFNQTIVRPKIQCQNEYDIFCAITNYDFNSCVANNFISSSAFSPPVSIHTSGINSLS